MSDARSRMASRVALPLITALIAASAMLWHHLPVPTQIYAPFDAHGSSGNPVRGTSLAVTATRVQIAPKGKFYTSQRFSSILLAGGTWLVVDATVSALTSTSHPTADLVVGDNTYLPSSQTPPGFGGQVDPGLPQHGHWVFDVAPELLQPSPAKPLQLRVWSGGDTRLNSRLVINLDTARFEHADAVTVKPYEVGPAE